MEAKAAESGEMASEHEKPEFLTAPAKQPPVDPRLRLIAFATRNSLDTATRYLIALPAFPTEQERSVWMWHTALTTLAWDVSEVAIVVSSDSPSLRAARSLNRMLLEYAARVHLYLAHPELAELHVGQAPNMLRRVMKAAAAAPATDPGLDQVKALFESGTTKANQPRTREMFVALVSSFIADPTKWEPYVEFLDAEYALGNGYVHGSQSSFFDLFDASDVKLHPRTRVLHRRAEVLRCVTCMLALLAGIEKRYAQDFGVGDHVATLRSLGPFDKVTSMGTHDTLMMLLGITHSGNTKPI